MTLSWALRLFCILIVIGGCTLAASQIALALTARTILRHLDALTPRWRERILFLLQIGPALFAVFISGAFCLPSYIHGETNLQSETVSSLCLFLAAIMIVWFASTFLRALPITLRTLRVARACSRSGRLLLHSGGIPVLAVLDHAPPLCLIGFFHPLILISTRLTGTSPEAIELALAHERSHAAHHDNWKLLALSFLPRLHRLLPGGDPWALPWQQAADWAADDDAVQHDSARSMLLAEALVTAARAANSVQPSRSYICTALTAADAALGARIDRLIQPRQNTGFSGASVLFTLTATAIFLSTAACALSPWIYEFCERLLHL